MQPLYSRLPSPLPCLGKQVGMQVAVMVVASHWVTTLMGEPPPSFLLYLCPWGGGEGRFVMCKK